MGNSQHQRLYIEHENKWVKFLNRGDLNLCSIIGRVVEIVLFDNGLLIELSGTACVGKTFWSFKYRNKNHKKICEFEIGDKVLLTFINENNFENEENLFIVASRLA